MDQILYWNEVSLEANRVSHTNGKKEQTGPALSSRALAIVHLAMYDAFVGVSKKLTPYLPGLPAPVPGGIGRGGDSRCGACHAVEAVPQPKAVLRSQARASGVAGTWAERRP